jgi:hypothetical protein
MLRNEEHHIFTALTECLGQWNIVEDDELDE